MTLPVGDRIRKAREMSDLTQEELAERISVTARTLIRYERGETKPKPHVLREVAHVTGANLSWLQTGRGEVSRPKPQEPQRRPDDGPMLFNAPTDEEIREYHRKQQEKQAQREKAEQPTFIIEVMTPDGQDVWFGIEPGSVKIVTPVRVKGRVRQG